MDRLLIDDNVLQCAKMYEQTFRAKFNDIPAKLRTIKDKLDTYNVQNGLSVVELAEYKNYVEEIALDFDNADPTKNLLVLQPRNFQDYIDKYRDIRFQHVDLSRKLLYRIQIGGANPGKKFYKKFWELIVDEMHYSDGAHQSMIPYIEKLGIRTCVYCNLQYALTINHNQGLFELDHRFPKSKYPYFCVTFFNLQPSCPSCNHGKKTATADFGLYTNYENEQHPFHLLSMPHLYLRKRRLDPKYINIRLVSSDTADPTLCNLADSHQRDFNINDTYGVVKDVAEETIWRCKAFDNTYKELFLRNFPELYDKDALHRFVFGAYSDDSNVHQRPLTKLIRDIEKDMGVVINP